MVRIRATVESHEIGKVTLEYEASCDEVRAHRRLQIRAEDAKLFDEYWEDLEWVFLPSLVLHPIRRSLAKHLDEQTLEYDVEYVGWPSVEEVIAGA